MVHNLVAATFNILSAFTKISKHLTNMKAIKEQNDIPDATFNLLLKMAQDLLYNLDLFTSTGSPGIFFSEQALSYHLFFKEPLKQKEIPEEEGKDPKKGKFNNHISKKPAGCIVNSTGRLLVFPWGLTTRYCKDIFDTGRECRYGKSCNFA